MEVNNNESLSSTDKLMQMMKEAADELNTDQSFFVVDLSDVKKKFNYWKLKLPRIHPFYAVKTNAELPFLRFMSALGAHFDCASKEEIDWALSAGATPSEIIYAHTAKYPSHLHYAKSLGVDLMTFDSEAELIKIHEIFPSARLVLRFHVPGVNAYYEFENKFGCEMEECGPLLKMARRLGFEVVGTCFHVGGLCNEPEGYSRAITMAREIFDLAKDIGYEFTLLDIGGGFPGYLDCYAEFDEICFCINKSLDEHFSNDENIRIIAEPGCYFACSAFTLCTRILGKRKVVTSSQNSEEKVMYLLNDGLYGSFFKEYELYKVQIRPLLGAAEQGSRPILNSKLWGYTCSPDDYIKKECFLPEMNVGEYIVFDNMGAYTISIVSNFNGFPRPLVRYVGLSDIEYGDLMKSKINDNSLSLEQNVDSR